MKLNKIFKKVLVLCPHTDDEFGCAGAILKLVEQGSEIHYFALSRCEESVPKGFSEDTLYKECKKATKSLGINQNNVRIGTYKVRYLHEDRQNILEEFVKINNTLNPDLVLLPSSYDIHQDHRVVYKEGVRAFKFSTILGYELPQNITSSNNAAFISLTREQIDKKIQVMSNYKSQVNRKYSREEFIRGLAAVRGVQCASEYAESFEVIRLML